MEKNKVCLYIENEYSYPDKSTDFRPDENYPEYLFKNEISSANSVYRRVREAFKYLGMDKNNFNKSSWNPMGEIVSPGDNVLIKPNMVMDVNTSGEGEECLYTHPSVVFAVVDYVLIALKGKGKIIIGDAPMQECNFNNLIEKSGYKSAIEFYRKKGINIEIVDFRELKSEIVDGIHVQHINEDSKGVVVDLKNDSEFNVYSEEQLNRLRITNYDPSILPMHHQPGKHEYYISEYVLNADVIINMPKPKTHRKAGVTISLKNLVGTNTRKEYLPHHCIGSALENGDEYADKNIFKKINTILLDKINFYSFNDKITKARLLSFMRKVNALVLRMNKDKYSEGSWYGNNTISKTIIDINKIILYCDKEGRVCDEMQRKYFIVADMIVSGEKEGPVIPSRKNVGMIAMGYDPVFFDKTVATVMGMDIKKIPTLRQAESTVGKLKITNSKTKKPFIVSNNNIWNEKDIADIKLEESLMFEPTSGWKNHIEL